MALRDRACAGLALAVVLSAATARAEQDAATTKARVHLRAGIADYDEGRYAEAASEMAQAYALKPLPALQYNLAQCYERLGKLEDAAKAYETYLTGGDAGDREVVLKRIENLRAREKAQTEGQAQATPPPPEEKVVFKTIVVYREVPPPPGRLARAAAYGLFALGAAGLATGIAFAVLTVQASNQVHDDGNPSNPPSFNTASATQANGHLYPIGTGVGFGVGALAIGGGIGLFLAGRKLDHDAQKQRDAEQARIDGIAPWFSASGGGFAAHGVF